MCREPPFPGAGRRGGGAARGSGRKGRPPRPAPARWRRLGAVAALALLCACACHHRDEGAATPLPRVRVQIASPQSVDETVALTGLLVAPPGRDVKLGALVPGRLARVAVAEGDAVKQGQVLGEIETGPASDELAQAEATRSEAEAAARAVESRQVRTESLVKKGVAAQQEAEQAGAELAAARASLDRARAAVAQARRKLSRSALIAPFDGVVVAVLVRAGEAVDGNGQPVIEVAGPDPLELRCAVPPRDAARLRAGLAAQVTMESLGLTRPAQVIAVAPAADAQSGNVTVRLRLDNADRALKLGVLGRATVAVGRIDSAIVVPSTALVPGPDGGVAVVVVAAGGKTRTAEVRTAFESAGRAALVSGVDAGEALVVEGGYALPDGSQVEVVP